MIASTLSVPDLGPIGSHPLLDPNYSSAAVRILHDGSRLSRLEKVGLIAEWDEALHTLRSCFNAFRPPEALNCGMCEKCLRTMTELYVCGKLRQCPTYLLDDISPDLLRTLKVVLPAEPGAPRDFLLQHAYLMLGAANVYNWRELLPPLREIGRHDLVAVIAAKLAEYVQYRARVEERDWRGVVKRLDRQYLGGRLVQLCRGLRGGLLPS